MTPSPWFTLASTTSSLALTTLALVDRALAQQLALHDALAVSAHDALALVFVAPNPCSNDFLSFQSAWKAQSGQCKAMHRQEQSRERAKRKNKKHKRSKWMGNRGM